MLPNEYEPQRQIVSDLRAACKKKPMPVEAQAIANYIQMDEQRVGSRFITVEGRPYLFTARKRQLLDIGKERKFAAYLAMVYGLNVKEQATSMVISLLESYAVWNGEKRQLRRWCEFRDGILYLSNYDGRVWRVSGEGVTEDPNTGALHDDLWSRGDPISPATPPVGIGIENNGEHAVFADDDEGVPVIDPVIGRNGKLFRLLGSISWAKETLGQMGQKEQIRTLLIWMFAIAFPDVMPTKPILIAEGAPGSGKSLCLQAIQAMVHGSTQTLSISKHGERDFWVSLLRNPIAVMDNTDDFIEWLPDALCGYATGSGKVERELHTNTGEVRIRPRAFLAVASKDPKSFRRDDVADRSIVLRMEKRPKERQGSADDILRSIVRDREVIYGEYLYYLNRVVASLNRQHVYQLSHRMADFEKFAHAVGEAFNWPARHVQEVMNAIQRERTAFAAENDVVVELLDSWVDRTGNEQREVAARDLFHELRVMAELDGKIFVKSPQALAQRLRAPHVNERFIIHTFLDRDRKLYRIARWGLAPEEAPN